MGTQTPAVIAHFLLCAVPLSLLQYYSKLATTTAMAEKDRTGTVAPVAQALFQPPAHILPPAVCGPSLLLLVGDVDGVVLRSLLILLRFLRAALLPSVLRKGEAELYRHYFCHLEHNGVPL